MILESSTERPNANADVNYKTKLINTALHSQQEPVLVQGSQPDYSRSSAHGFMAMEEKEHTSDNGIEDIGNEDELKERISEKESSTKRARSLFTSPEPIKRCRRHLDTCSRMESEPEDASDAHHKISQKRLRIGKKHIVSSQSATVPDGD